MAKKRKPRVGPRSPEGYFMSAGHRATTGKGKKGKKRAKKSASKRRVKKTLKKVPTHLGSTKYTSISKSGNAYTITRKFVGYKPAHDKRKKARKSK